MWGDVFLTIWGGDLFWFMVGFVFVFFFLLNAVFEQVKRVLTQACTRETEAG